jgi:hypothetical protein
MEIMFANRGCQIPFFKMYTQYCYNYTKAITHLAQYKEKNTKFRSFLRVSLLKLKVFTPWI